MTQIIVTIEDNRLVPELKRSIALMNGVKTISVRQSNDVRSIKDRYDNISAPVRCLMGIASSVSFEDIASDDGLSYILNR